MATITAVSFYARQRVSDTNWVMFVRGVRRDGSVAWEKSVTISADQVKGLEDLLQNAQVLLAANPDRVPTTSV